MYPELTEQQKVDRYLKGRQWVRTAHGSLFDRGSADSYYGRARRPHYGGVGGDSGPRVEVSDCASVTEYNQGYNDNTAAGCFKDWG